MRRVASLSVVLGLGACAPAAPPRPGDAAARQLGATVAAGKDVGPLSPAAEDSVKRKPKPPGPPAKKASGPGPVVRPASRHDTSKPLRDLPQVQPTSGPIREMHPPRRLPKVRKVPEGDGGAPPPDGGGAQG
jgi:hypothetical protein